MRPRPPVHNSISLVLPFSSTQKIPMKLHHVSREAHTRLVHFIGILKRKCTTTPLCDLHCHYQKFIKHAAPNQTNEASGNHTLMQHNLRFLWKRKRANKTEALPEEDLRDVVSGDDLQPQPHVQQYPPHCHSVRIPTSLFIL